MVPAGPHRSPASERAVHGAGDTCRKAADSAGQVLPVRRFDDEMKMIVLCGKRDDPEPLVRGGGDRAADRRKNAIRSETAHGWRGP